MGPYRQGAMALRARRDELRHELDDVDEKMSELEISRACILSAIEDLDERLQVESAFRPPRRSLARRRPVAIIAFGVSVLAVLLTVGVATTPRVQPRCVEHAGTTKLAGILPMP